jgi:hypothetical protein
LYTLLAISASFETSTVVSKCIVNTQDLFIYCFGDYTAPSGTLTLYISNEHILHLRPHFLSTVAPYPANFDAQSLTFGLRQLNSRDW